jgi:hypothetical protein
MENNKEYLHYREMKYNKFRDVIADFPFIEKMTEDELKALEFGFKKGLDTATKGGSIQRQIDELISLNLWSARRLHPSHKVYAYDDLEKITGIKYERV